MVMTSHRGAASEEADYRFMIPLMACQERRKTRTQRPHAAECCHLNRDQPAGGIGPVNLGGALVVGDLVAAPRSTSCHHRR